MDRPAAILAALLLVSLAACDLTGPDDWAEGDGVVGDWVWSGGRRRTYTLTLPTTHDASGRAPLLIAFHGFGGTGESFARLTGLRDAALDAGFITVFADGVGTSWQAGCDCTEADRAGVDDVLFTTTLIEQLAGSLPVDTDRVYVAGYSQGASLTHLLACAIADRIAGAASVAATMFNEVAAACDPARPVPFIFFHGDNDRVFPWMGIPPAPALPASLAPMDTTFAWWAAWDGCDGAPAMELVPDTADDGTRVVLRRHDDCAAGARAWLYVIAQGGHTWPGAPEPFPPGLGLVTREVDASRRIVDFFQESP